MTDRATPHEDRGPHDRPCARPARAGRQDEEPVPRGGTPSDPARGPARPGSCPAGLAGQRRGLPGARASRVGTLLDRLHVGGLGVEGGVRGCPFLRIDRFGYHQDRLCDRRGVLRQFRRHGARFRLLRWPRPRPRTRTPEERVLGHGAHRARGRSGLHRDVGRLRRVGHGCHRCRRVGSAEVDVTGRAVQLIVGRLRVTRLGRRPLGHRPLGHRRHRRDPRCGARTEGETSLVVPSRAPRASRHGRPDQSRRCRPRPASRCHPTVPSTAAAPRTAAATAIPSWRTPRRSAGVADRRAGWPRRLGRYPASGLARRSPLQLGP